MLKLTLTSALIGATSAQMYTNQCPKGFCSGTGTAVAAVVKADAVKYDCTKVTTMPLAALNGCVKSAVAGSKEFAVATCTGTSTVLTPAVAADVCAFVKTSCIWMCPAGCTSTPVISGKYMKGYVKAVAAVAEQKDVACTLANANTSNEARAACKGFASSTCTGKSTAKVWTGANSLTTCAAGLDTCSNFYPVARCAAATGCKFTAAKYTAVAGAGAEKFTIPAVVEVKAVKGVETACTAAEVAGEKTCISTPACTGTATNKGTNKGTTKALPAAAGTDVTICGMKTAAGTGLAAECDTGCKYTAHVPGTYTGVCTVVKTAAVAAVDGFTPMCSTSCMSKRFQPTIRTTYTNVGCAPGCTMTAPVPVVPAVAPSPAKSSSASAATMAAATIALSAIAAIVAL